MKLATTTSDFQNYTDSQAETLKYIRNAGFQYADYNFCIDHRKKNGVYSENFQNYFDEMNKAAETQNVKLVQAHSPMGRPLDDGGQLLNDTLRCVDACGAWGIPNLVVHSGYMPGISAEETLLRNKEFFMPLLERAERYGLNILVENFNKMYLDGWWWIDNATDLKKMVELVNHPLFHAVWDVGHANLQEMPQDEELRLLGSHVRALHIHDNMSDSDDHLAPYLGNLNFDSVMTGLADIGYNGYFTFEVGGFFTPAEKRRTFARDNRLIKPPLELREAFERYLYDLGKCILQKYGCFEE
jgi:sugar phosphate isomerase/epimerase